MKPQPIPEGIASPPEGFIYMGRGPMEVRPNPYQCSMDLIYYEDGYGWVLDGWDGGDRKPFALRKNSVLAELNGLPLEKNEITPDVRSRVEHEFGERILKEMDRVIRGTFRTCIKTDQAVLFYNHTEQYKRRLEDAEYTVRRLKRGIADAIWEDADEQKFQRKKSEIIKRLSNIINSKTKEQ